MIIRRISSDAMEFNATNATNASRFCLDRKSQEIYDDVDFILEGLVLVRKLLWPLAFNELVYDEKSMESSQITFAAKLLAAIVIVIAY